MRQPQNNNKNRSRGRGRNQGNKQSNSLNRNYESNGPDVKIRGNAAHIAEKYVTLARDALSSGDRVIAENYLQHAEHYNRIVLAANAQREEQQAAQAALRASQQQEQENQADTVSDSDSTSDGDNTSDTNERRPRRRDSRGENRNNQRSGRQQEASEDIEASQSGNNENNGAANGSGEVEAGASEDVKPKTRRTSRKKPETAENISDDAAALPQGLLGAGSAKESASAEE